MNFILGRVEIRKRYLLSCGHFIVIQHMFLEPTTYLVTLVILKLERPSTFAKTYDHDDFACDEANLCTSKAILKKMCTAEETRRNNHG